MAFHASECVSEPFSHRKEYGTFQQVMRDVVEPVYKAFDCMEYVYAEYKRRVFDRSVRKPFRIMSPFAYIFIHRNGGEFEENVIKMGECFGSPLIYKDIFTIPLGNCNWLGLLMDKNSIYVLDKNSVRTHLNCIM